MLGFTVFRFWGVFTRNGSGFVLVSQFLFNFDLSAFTAALARRVCVRVVDPKYLAKLLMKLRSERPLASSLL